jgi:hypothetical protein
VVHTGQQVRPAAVATCPAGAAEGLAVDGDRPPQGGRGSGTHSLPVGQPGADRSGQGVGVQAGKGAADGGLGRDGEAAGGVAAATGRSRVGDSGEVGEQVRAVGVLEFDRVGVGEVGQGGWDRG